MHFNCLKLILYKKFKKIGFILTINQNEKLLKYLFLIKKWNKIYNLTTIKTSEKIIYYHFLDSLIIIKSLILTIKFLNKKNFLLDVGSGVGIPGIIISILLEKFFPKTVIHLIDSNNKKSTFLNQVKLELELKNTFIYNVRIENFKKNNFYYNIIISRGFSKINKFILISKHLLKLNGLFFTMKFITYKKEIKNILNKYFVKKCLKFKIPNLNKKRYLIIISNNINFNI